LKNFKLLAFALIVSLAAVSCSDDGDETTLVSGNKYETTYVKMDMSGTSTVSIELKSKEELVEWGFYHTVEFKADGKLYYEDYEAGTWTQSGNTLNIITDGESGTATVSGDKITVKESETEDGETVDMTIEYTKM
jgi:hypothetical protein